MTNSIDRMALCIILIKEKNLYDLDNYIKL